MDKMSQEYSFIPDERDTAKDSGLCQESLGANPERVPPGKIQEYLVIINKDKMLKLLIIGGEMYYTWK